MTSGRVSKANRTVKEKVVQVTGSIGCCVYPQAGFYPDVMLSFISTFIQDPGIFNGHFLMKKTGPSVDEARNLIVEHFIANPDCGDYLVFVDSDQVWDPFDMYAFLRRAKERDVKLVSALIPRYVEPTREIECPFVVIRVWENGYLETRAMSGGVYAIRRDLCQELWDRYGGAFVSAPVGMHEDSMLGSRVRTLLVPTLVDPEFSVGHLKDMILRFPPGWNPADE